MSAVARRSGVTSPSLWKVGRQAALICRADAELLAQLKRDFANDRRVKPAASRQDSSKSYVQAMGLRGFLTVIPTEFMAAPGCRG